MLGRPMLKPSPRLLREAHNCTGYATNGIGPTVQVNAQEVIGGQALATALGPADQATVFAAIADVTAEAPAGAASGSPAGKPLGSNDEATERQQAERRLIPARSSSCTLNLAVHLAGGTYCPEV